ncbi:MAG: chromosome segregation protein SMC [Proteobacteria bacterium]|nr:chromosome segregation protein SMC [Pseudomonadota bacterium]
MRIKRIEIIGFKSFCDRSTIHIDSPITSVVGPNGCGKSNIVDAIRWCMGEQSAKHLRGKAMDDVIFAGSESRNPAAMAEVSLTFEDVGFSHETLKLALDQSQLEGSEESQPDSQPEGVVESQFGDPPGQPESQSGQMVDETVESQPGDLAGDELAGDDPVRGDPADRPARDEDEPMRSVRGDSGNTDSELPTPTAAREVEEFLEDRPPAFDFARFSEVTIARRLFRDGTSQYMINKTPCRLRDVTDFFLGTGIGTKAYSIIEQGRIGMIVSSRPQERRTLIEEAAGITKFKTKKRAAERKLEQTRQNLLRVSDIVVELSKRLASLHRQAQKAERYRRYKAEVRDIELWKAAHKYLELVAEQKMLATALTETRESLDDSRAELDGREAAVIAERADLAVEERRLNGLQEAIFELENRIKLSESKVEFQTREAEELDERVASFRGDVRSLSDRRTEGADQLETQRRELDDLSDLMGREGDSVAAAEAQVGEARQMLANAQSRLDEARSQLSQARSDLVRAESKKDGIERHRDESSRRLERLGADEMVAGQHAGRLEREVRKLDGKLAELRQTRFDLGSQLDDLEGRRTELADSVERCEAEVENTRAELHRRRSRLQSLVEIHEKYEGFARGTRAIMQASESLSAPGQEIRGLVADVVAAPPDLEVAVEAALGDRLGSVMVSSAAVGLRGIDYLKKTSTGRSTFVAVEHARPDGASSNANGEHHGGEPSDDCSIQFEDRTGATETGGTTAGELDRPVEVSGLAAVIRHLAGLSGVIGCLADLVHFESGFEQIGSRLFGECVVVEDLERAIELQRAGFAVTMVTVGGDVVDRHGVISGGSRDDHGASVLAQKREIRQLEAVTAELEGNLAQSTARLVAAKTELTRITRTLDSLRKESHEGEIAITSHEKDLVRCRAEMDRARERLNQLGAEKLELDERIRKAERELAETAELHASASDRIERYERKQLGYIEAVTSGSERVEELARLLTEAKVHAAKLGEKRASVQASVLGLEASDRDLGERIDKLEGNIEDSTRRASELRSESTTLADELGRWREQRRTQAEQLEQGRSAYELRVAELEVVEVQARELRTRAERLAGQANHLELKLGNVGANQQALEESVFDRYGLDIARNLSEYHLRCQVAEAEEKRLTELRRLIERMGSDINLTAIDEYADVSQRHEFLSSQKSDLENAVDQLERAIAKINRTSRKLFRDTFNAINEQFQTLFPRLFRGGRARLQLVMPKGHEADSDVDVLDAGVEVVAQPPGKKNTTVDQLSGGEKALTAVALIFSIFLIKSSPFCLLDEVDAPLDDANVDRYNELIRELTDRSQFIIITHNKRTMEIADSLYGVTMQEPGVSKLVSVNLRKFENRAAA